VKLEIDFSGVLRDYQLDIVNSEARFTITEASTKAGKTFSHILWLYKIAHERDNSNFWWVAPVYSQAEIAYLRLKSYTAKYGVYKYHGGNVLTITLPNGSKIWFKSADNPDNLYGEDVWGAVFDEAPRAKVESWYALRSTLTATRAKCKIIGNFGGSANWVHQLKEKAKSDPEYAYFKVTAYDAVRAGILDLAEVEQAKKDLPLHIFKQLYLAEATETEGQLVTNESINALIENSHVKHGIGYITCDPAREGDDRAVIMVWSGFQIIDVITFDKCKLDELANEIKKLMTLYGVHRRNVICDTDGLGAGVVDIIRCKEFHNNRRANEPLKFFNAKEENEYNLATKIMNGEIWLKDLDYLDLIKQELETLLLDPKKLSADGKYVFVKKAAVKGLINRSPDFKDSMSLRLDFEPFRKKGSIRQIN
jgi:hypothetical protein